MPDNKQYIQFVQELKDKILYSRYQAAKLVNRELLLLYFSVGKSLSQKVDAAAWGAKVLERISEDLQKELPGLRGFSHRNLKNMRFFYESYSGLEEEMHSLIENINTSKMEKGQSATAQMDAAFFEEIFTALSFTHHILLLNKCKPWDERSYYMQQSAAHQWSVSVLQHHIEGHLYKQRGKLPNNFKTALPPKLYTHALEAFKDEYLLEFININPEDSERVLEDHIVQNIRQFILSLGTGFSFIGNQYRLQIGDQEFFIDLLFFNRRLQCLVAIDLKTGKFKPAYAGQLNFYLNVLDDKVKLPHENPSIGIVLCKEKNNTVVEYSFRNVDKAMGVATYKTGRQLPAALKKILPSAEDLKKLL